MRRIFPNSRPELDTCPRQWSRTLRVFGFLCLICLLQPGQSFSQPQGKRITFYTSQTGYSLPIIDRNNTAYVGLIEAVEPLGSVNARLDGGKWKLKFRNVEAQFEVSKSKAKVHGKNVQLGAPFLIENAHGLVPLGSLRDLLTLFELSPIDYHEAAHRVFIGAPAVHVSMKKIDTGKVAFAFSAPVNPAIATEAGRLRMVFSREPLLSDTKPVTFDDKVIASATYSETNGTAELTVLSPTPLAATFSEDRRVITISAVPQPAPAAPLTTAKPGSPAPQPTSPATSQSVNSSPKPHPFVVIDAAHGGTDKGATLTPTLSEKDVTLSFAHRLRHELEVHGVSSVLVRDGDSSLSFDQRTAIANSSGASFYISIHASGFGRGLRIFSSTIAAQNHTLLSFVPVQMAQSPHVNQSRAAALAIVQALTTRDISCGALALSVAPLNSVSIPALAVEIAPTQGSADELGNVAYQQSIASAFAVAVAGLHAQGGPR